MFFSTRNERLGLLLATIIFAIVAVVQLWRGFANVSLSVGGHAIPDWVSLLAGLVALLMAVWMGTLLKNRRPLV